jgi:hypothetical protein
VVLPGDTMSANIYYRPLKKTDASISVGSPSSFIEAMNNAFGESRVWNLNTTDIATLRGMRAASKDPIYGELIDLIEKLDGIEVYYNY